MTQLMYNALEVIAQTPIIRTFLEINAPQILEQIEVALDSGGVKPSLRQYIKTEFICVHCGYKEKVTPTIIPSGFGDRLSVYYGSDREFCTKCDEPRSD